MEESSQPREPDTDLRSFEPGERVRIYLGYVTDGQIKVREGMVLGHKKEKVWSMGEHTGSTGDALEMRVEKVGTIIAEEPREVSVYHKIAGHWVNGRIYTHEPSKPYVRSFFYRCISGAEKI